jgi:hypothetical protein
LGGAVFLASVGLPPEEEELEEDELQEDELELEEASCGPSQRSSSIPFDILFFFLGCPAEFSSLRALFFVFGYVIHVLNANA